MTSAQLEPIPTNYESGYRDGVWVTAKDLFPDEDIQVAFEEGMKFFLIFTTYHLGPEPEERDGDTLKNLMGVEVTYAENEYLDEVWGLRLDKYVDLGTVRGRKEVRKMTRKGEFNHIDAVYGEANVKFISFVANFDELAEKILKYVNKQYKPTGLDADSAEVIRYYRPLEIPKSEKAWYSDGYWLDRDAFETQTLQDLDFLPQSDYPATAIVFTSSNYLTGNEADLGVFMMVYEELEMGSYAGGYSMESFDAFPYETEFRFLGFIGPQYQVPNLKSVETFLSSNEVLFEEYSRAYVDFFYAGKINTFSDLRDGIVEAILGWDDTTSVRKMNIFK